MELLRAGDEWALSALAAAEPRATRHLLGRLWDPDEGMRRAAARGLAEAAATHPALGLDLIRRLMWTLNDESATNGRYAVVALGEIGHRSPQLIAPFVAPLASLSWDVGLRMEIIEALTRIAAAAPELVRAVQRVVADHVDGDDPGEHAALQRLFDQSGGLDEA